MSLHDQPNVRILGISTLTDDANVMGTWQSASGELPAQGELIRLENPAVAVVTAGGALEISPMAGVSEIIAYAGAGAAVSLWVPDERLALLYTTWLTNKRSTTP